MPLGSGSNSPALLGVAAVEDGWTWIYLSRGEMGAAVQVWSRVRDSYEPDRGDGRWTLVQEPPTTVVPDPSTYFAGALVLLPMAAQALRFVRKQRVA